MNKKSLHPYRTVIALGRKLFDVQELPQGALPRYEALYKDGEPCSHLGCQSHQTHPCEKCGRIGCNGIVKENLFIRR